MVLTSGCVKNKKSIAGVVDSACVLFQPITFSIFDTQETVEAIGIHNDVWNKSCIKTIN